MADKKQLARAADVLGEYAATIEQSEIHHSGPLKGRCDPETEAEVAEYRSLASALAAAASSTVTPHPIADKATEPHKSAAFEWLRGMALGTPEAINDKAARAKAALALDEWHRCEQASRSVTAAPLQRIAPSCRASNVSMTIKGRDWSCHTCGASSGSPECRWRAPA